MEKRVTNLGELYSGELIHWRGAYLRNFKVYNVLSVCLLLVRMSRLRKILEGYSESRESLKIVA